MVCQDSRRGQSASGAAILIAIIAGMLVLYILFLPGQSREEILFGDGQGGSGGIYGSGSGGVLTGIGPTVLLTAVPGTLRLQRFPTEEHSIPSATIFTAVETHELRSIDSAIVKNSVFSSKSVDLEFDVHKDSTMNYLLSFNVNQAAQGPLRVLLNGRLLYERPIAPGTPPPVTLPADLLEEGKNTLTLSTESAGLAFWRRNSYLLSNILVSADVVDESGSTSMQTFSLIEREIATMERAELQFVPECDPRRAGRLTVQLNSRLIRGYDNTTQEVPNTLYTGFVDCGVLFKTDVPEDYLMRGENRVLFASQGGQYIVDRIKLIVYLQQSDYPVYYFNLNPDMFDALDQGFGAVRLTMTFADYRVEKDAEIVINGFVQSFRTNEIAWQALVDPAILVPGPNTVQVLPHVDKMDIAELRIELI